MANGFTPSRHLQSGNCTRTNRYKVNASNAAALYKGDAVILVSGAVTVAATNGDSPVLGVIAALYDSNGRPLTHNQPTSGPYLPAATVGFADVFDDPNIVYEVVADSACSDLDIGQIGTLLASTSGSPALGRSAQQIDASSIVAETTANADTLAFKMVGLSKRNVSGTYAEGQTIEVIISNHVFNPKS